MSSSDYLGFVRGEDFINLPRDPETWLIKPLVPTGGYVNLYGQPKKAKKSYLALGMAWAISSGQAEWLGFEVKHHGPVLYFQADTPHNLWVERIEDLSKGGYDFSNVWFASMATIPYPFNIVEHEDILNEMVARVPESPIMITYDTSASMHTLNENQQQDMTLFMHAIAKASGRQAKLLITHSKKGGGEGAVETDKSEDHEAEGGDLMRGNRGSGAIAGGMDTIMKVTPKGHLYYQGRAVGEEHLKMKFTHVYGEKGFMWEADVSPIVVSARKLLGLYKSGSERSLAGLLAKEHGVEVEAARAILRRQKEKGH